MTDRQKLLAALVSKPDPRAGVGLSVLDIAAMIERARGDQRTEVPAAR